MIFHIKYSAAINLIKNSQNMKAGVPAVNVLVSVLYILLAGVVAYWLKLAHRKRLEWQQSHSAEQLQAMRKEVDYNRVFAMSWFKKYSLVGACFNHNRKYLLKQIFIVSTYAVTCLKINKIILWPVAFALFLLPLIFALLEVAVGLIEKKIAEEEKKGKNQTVNNMHEHEIEIEAVNIELSRPASGNAQIQVMKERSLVQIIAVSLLTFITFILFYQTIFTLTNSVSNSGQLNITSLIIILLIDQLAIRVGVGLLAFAALKILDKNGIINFSTNAIVSCLCHEELVKVFIELKKQRARRELQNTASPLKHRQSNQALKPQLKAECQSSQNNHINLINLQPQTLSHNEPQEQAEQEEQEQEDELEREIYLTTPEKQLFEGNEEEEESVKDRSILHTIIDNKENETVNNQLNKSTLNYHQESKGIEDIISSKGDHMENLQNFKTDFGLENSRQGRVQKKGKKKAKRVLKLTGNSPYLQYLPNMLKNIDKVKNAQKDKKML